MDVQFCFFLFAEFPHGIVHYVFGYVLGRIEDTVFLAFCFLFVELYAVNFSIYAFNFVEGVFKNMSKNVYIHLAFKIVFGQNGSVLKEQFIVYFNSIKNRIRLKQPTIVGKNLMILSFPTFVQITKILFVTLIKWGIGIHLFECFPLL